jgi:hypothetical protein
MGFNFEDLDVYNKAIDLVSHIQISVKQRYIDDGKFVDLKSELTDLSKMLSGLKQSINQ